MPSIVRLDKKGLIELIENVKNNGGNPTELEGLLNDINGDENDRRPVRRQSPPFRILVEEPTTEARLEKEVGELFSSGITGSVLAEVIEFDRNHTLAELKNMCVEAGLSPSGHKKEMAARLIAKGIK